MDDVVSEHAFRPVRLAVVLLVVAALLAPFAGDLLLGDDLRHWQEVRRRGVPVAGVVEEYDETTLVVAYTDPASGERATVTTSPDRSVERGAAVTVMVHPEHPHYPVLRDASLDPAPVSGLLWGAFASAAYVGCALLFLGYRRHLRATYRDATWQPALATPWSQAVGVGPLVRLSLYRPGAVAGDRPVRSVGVLWDPALLALEPGQAVEVSGDPGADAVVVVRHGADVFWPVSVAPRQSRGVADAAPAYGDGESLPRPRRHGAAFGVATRAVPALLAAFPFARGTGSPGGIVAVYVGALPLAYGLGVFLGWTPSLRDSVRVAQTARFQRLAPGRRAPWYLQLRFALPLLVVAILAAVAVTV
jgi:hypothetical protein